MHCTVESHHRAQGREQTNHESDPHRGPITTIAECKQCSSCIVPRCQNPEGDHDSEKSNDVNEQDESFDEW